MRKAESLAATEVKSVRSASHVRGACGDPGAAAVICSDTDSGRSFTGAVDGENEWHEDPVAEEQG